MTEDTGRATPVQRGDEPAGIVVPPRPPLPVRAAAVPPRPPMPVPAPTVGARPSAAGKVDAAARAAAGPRAWDIRRIATWDVRRIATWDVRRIAMWALAAYAIALVLIAVWPTPVDQGARPWIDAVGRVIPPVTINRVEFAANILYFVPLGALLALLLTRRYLIVPIAVVTTVSIESVQALLLAARVPSVLDIVANVTGACVGLLIVEGAEWWRRRTPSD
ncbi:VanZ family protein [Microbacterium thalassium]|uniref:VanZ family protein n=1 Tax=Microbacterium thalassium TaxID=362649 RepID=A0A7X0FQ43_9MICO|nr:VanZ family protein [Microbacterium thalassium]MBB6391087.1 VanZ family protein [Microbacterium thalassium]GLK23802.1 hypothetical protein GCM10017607_11200 [Microbacterium thalassium]